MANPELGAKQVCPSCQTKFYDLNHRPATCPKCGASFDPEEAVRSRRVRARAAPDYGADDEPAEKVRKTGDDAEGFEDEVEEAPGLDEAAEAEPVEADETDEPASAPAAGGDQDLGVDFEEEVAEEAEDVPFLEEEDEDDAFPDDDIVVPEDGRDDH